MRAVIAAQAAIHVPPLRGGTIGGQGHSSPHKYQ